MCRSFSNNEDDRSAKSDQGALAFSAVQTSIDCRGRPMNSVIRWTRQIDGSYAKQGTLPADTPAVRILSIDEDYETNPHAVSAGQRLWPKEEAIALVESQIASGSYRMWRYEIRPEKQKADDPVAPLPATPTKSTEPRICANLHCKKGTDGTRGVVIRRNAKYCCPSCRVSVCRRNRPKPERAERPRRKTRCDKKYATQAARQRAYDHRKWGTLRERHAIEREYGIKSWTIR